MPFSAVCPSCSSRLKLPDHASGKKARCPGCKQLFVASVHASALQDDMNQLWDQIDKRTDEMLVKHWIFGLVTTIVTTAVLGLLYRSLFRI